jgi:hypothetical protein
MQITDLKQGFPHGFPNRFNALLSCCNAKS